MKRVENQDYYQILEVPHKASWGEIQKAYELAKATYSKGSLATYSLFDFSGRGRILDKIEEAYQILSHPEKRRKYDHALETLVVELASLPKDADALPPVPVATPPLFPAPTPIIQPPARMTIPAGENKIVSGKTLKALREKQGVSLDEIAEKTRINISYLEFMEANSFGSLPAPVYIISYLKQYAKIVALDNTILEGYMKEYQQWCNAPKQRERFQ